MKKLNINQVKKGDYLYWVSPKDSDDEDSKTGYFVSLITRKGKDEFIESWWAIDKPLEKSTDILDFNVNSNFNANTIRLW